MDLALIAPISLLPYQAETTTQLLLPQLANIPEYRGVYKDFAGYGDFIILDNGAAEGVWFTTSQLLDIATRFKVSEIAIPDVLGDTDATITRMNLFFTENEADLKAAGVNQWGPKLGFVAQGKIWQDSLRLVNDVMKGRWADQVSTVYLPRLLLNEGDLFARIALAHNIHQAYGDRLNIHLFGANYRWPGEILAIAKDCPYVRSMDTSLPFVLAMKGRRLGPPTKAERPEDYFQYEAKPGDRDLDSLFTYNTRLTIRWAGGHEWFE